MYINIDLHRELLVKYFMHACQIANSSIRLHRSTQIHQCIAANTVVRTILKFIQAFHSFHLFVVVYISVYEILSQSEFSLLWICHISYKLTKTTVFQQVRFCFMKYKPMYPHSQTLIGIGRQALKKQCGIYPPHFDVKKKCSDAEVVYNWIK